MSDETCACCPEVATADVWTTPVCRAHLELWGDESPMPAEIEAKALPEHFEYSVPGIYLAPLRQLKPGLMEGYYRKWTAIWVAKQKGAPRPSVSHFPARRAP